MHLLNFLGSNITFPIGMENSLYRCQFCPDNNFIYFGSDQIN